MRNCYLITFALADSKIERDYYIDGEAVVVCGTFPADKNIDYPAPIVDHALARERALAAFGATKTNPALD